MGQETPIDQSKGIVDMKNCKLNLSIIHCEKLRDIVGLGGHSPYQIWISPGSFVGLSGTVVDTTQTRASNEDTLNSGHASPTSWLQRIFRVRRLNKG